MDRPNEQAITIAKASLCPGQTIPDVTIRIEGEPPDWKGDVWMETSGAFYREEANRLADALFSALPGATIDRLLICLLERKASLFRVASIDGMSKAATWAALRAEDRAFVTDCLDAIRIDDEHRRSERLKALDTAAALLRVVDR